MRSEVAAWHSYHVTWLWTALFLCSAFSTHLSRSVARMMSKTFEGRSSSHPPVWIRETHRVKSLLLPPASIVALSSVIRQVAFLPSIAHRWPSAYSALLNEACQVSWDDGLLAFRCVQGIVRVVRCFSASGQPGSIDLISRAILPLLNPKYAQKWKNTATFFIFRRLAPTIVGLHPLDVEINTFSKYLNLDWTPFRGEWHHPMHFP